ncbi:MAG: lytic transglycosylase domain-containing protein [Clostridia bacterium]|nr:lytic transglycosylase domain-containing protein [Clostridia bacterium]
MSRSQRRTPHEKVQERRGILLIILLLLLIAATCLLDALRDDIARVEYPKKYSAYVEKYAAQYDLPAHLIYAVIHTESRFDSSAVSVAGAVGLMQLMPSTFRWISDDMLGERLPDGMIYDPETNIRYGCYYLRRLYDRYGDYTAALAAYNAGPTRVDTWLDTPGMTDENGCLLPERIPTDETARYVPAVLGAMAQYDALYPTEDPTP